MEAFVFLDCRDAAAASTSAAAAAAAARGRRYKKINKSSSPLFLSKHILIHFCS